MSSIKDILQHVPYTPHVEKFKNSPHLSCIEIWNFPTWQLFFTDECLISTCNKCVRLRTLASECSRIQISDLNILHRYIGGINDKYKVYFLTVCVCLVPDFERCVFVSPILRCVCLFLQFWDVCVCVQFWGEGKQGKARRVSDQMSFPGLLLGSCNPLICCRHHLGCQWAQKRQVSKASTSEVQRKNAWNLTRTCPSLTCKTCKIIKSVNSFTNQK